MEYWCYVKDHGNLKESDFLDADGVKFLRSCDSEVFNIWRERSQSYSDVSLANTLKSSIRSKFESRSIGIREDVSSDYSVVWLFQHRNDTSGKFLDLYRAAKESGIRDFLVITQSPEFKTKFMFDGSTMTFESINDDFDEFVHILEPKQEVRLFFLVMADLALHTSSFEKNGKNFLQLHESDMSRSGSDG